MTVRIIHGDCRDVLKTLPGESVHCVVTSPPYFGLRDYGVHGQIGLEASPDEYIAVQVAVFSEVRRVLRKDGTLWLNLGDSYAEEMTERFEIVEKTTPDGTFTGLRFYLELPVTVPQQHGGALQHRGPFMHHPGDDDSSAVTFWGKQDLRSILRLALKELDDYYAAREANLTHEGNR